MDCTVFAHYTHTQFLAVLTHKHTHFLTCTFSHTLMHSVPPYSPAPHSWAWGSSSDIWARQPAASLNSTCQAEQKHPPPSSDKRHSLPSVSLPPSLPLPPSANATIPPSSHFSPCQDRLLSRTTRRSSWLSTDTWQACSFLIFCLLKFESEMDRFQSCPLQQSSRMLKSIRLTINNLNWMKLIAAPLVSTVPKHGPEP